MAIFQRCSKVKILGSYALTFIRPLIGEGKKHSFDTEYGKFEVKLGRRQLRYLEKNPTCVKCGMTGNIYLLLQNVLSKSRWMQDPNYYQPFLKMYHKDANDGSHYLMTIDHIKPLSRGGVDAYSNYQTMCKDCNNKKGNKESIQYENSRR